MSTSTQSFRNVVAEVSIDAATTPKIYNVSVPNGGVEVSQALSADTKKFLIRVRDVDQLQLSFTAGQSNVDFFTIPRGCTYLEDLVDFNGSLYFQTTKDNQIVEILEWT